MAYLQRIRTEWKRLKKNPVCNCDAWPENESLLVWKANIMGPIKTPYEGGIFKLSITFSTLYPFKPPQVRFITKIFHPNIDSAGGICVDILKHAWSPILNIEKILLSICSLLNDPNPKDPLVQYAADLYTKDRKKFDEEAKNWTAIYANDI
jgi:ubiquitin-conjugating enzyme E2 D